MPDFRHPIAAAAAPPNGSSLWSPSSPCSPRRPWPIPISATGRARSAPADGNMIVNGSSDGEAVADPGDPVATARAAINSVLPSVSCTWLDIGTVEGGRDGLSVAMRGVAGDRDVAIDSIRSALVQAGLQNPNVRFDDVAPITQAGCSALDTFRQIRAREGGHLTTAAAALRDGDAGRRRLCRARSGHRADRSRRQRLQPRLRPARASSRPARSPIAASEPGDVRGGSRRLARRPADQPRGQWPLPGPYRRRSRGLVGRAAGLGPGAVRPGPDPARRSARAGRTGRTGSSRLPPNGAGGPRWSGTNR